MLTHWFALPIWLRVCLSLIIVDSDTSTLVRRFHTCATLVRLTQTRMEAGDIVMEEEVDSVKAVITKSNFTNKTSTSDKMSQSHEPKVLEEGERSYRI